MLLGERVLEKKTFSKLDSIFEEFAKEEFKALSERKRSERVNRALLELILKEPEPCFLLAAVLDFVEKVDREKVLNHYTFTNFELWLNQVSGLNSKNNLNIRAKIVGKKIDRNDYQALFPIGMGKVYEGTHFVTAHRSPDLDSTISSFWGWMDAFGARVGDSLHIWNVPEGPPPSQIEIDLIFRDIFGSAVFTHLAKTWTSLSLSGNDLMTQKGMIQKTPHDSITSIDHDRENIAVIIVDEEGFYLGDWRNFDVEGVRQVIILLSSCLRWFENNLHLRLISLFAKTDLRFDEIKPWLMRLFTMKLKECEPANEFSQKQRKEVDDFCVRVLGLEDGLEATFEQLGLNLARLGGVPFEGSEKLIDAMKGLFDHAGSLREERPNIFSFLEKAVRELHDAILKIRIRLEKLDIALQTKRDVFGHVPTVVTIHSFIEEIRQKMSSYLYLTVVYPDQGRMFPVGIIQARDLRKNILGTVSLRDFCNRNEMSIPDYLDVISVIDHHKSQLDTFSPPFAIIADVQSTNTLVAGQAFEINDRYSCGTQTSEEIEKQIYEQSHKLTTPSSIRLMQRLFKKRIAAQKKNSYYIHPDREYIEYLHFVYGILDDTDLLTKVSLLDIERLASLLNRLKSLTMQKEVEIISLDDLSKDRNYVRKAAQRILQNEDMYSLYKKVYEHREKEVEKNISLAARKKPSNFFADTKEQNGCCRVGQTKIFASNIALLTQYAEKLLRVWLEQAVSIHQRKPEIDLHIHMLSTIVSAEEVYKGKPRNSHDHKDELWIWIPEVETAIAHLKRFLTAFQSSPGLKNNSLEVEFLGNNAEILQMIFKECFFDIPHKISKKDLSIAILRYNAGTLNSRKTMISPFLPTI